ncbi:MAG: hypothetical protein IPI67_29610 [Myxococcales bacterium]|nr:hypothetical protein [Myxococcales bacterium]
MSEDDAKKAILSRRARFVAAALASAGLVVSTANCGGDTEKDKGDASVGGSGGTPQPCLSPPPGGSGGSGGTPEPCLGMPAGGYAGYAGAPGPCLSAPAGGYAGTGPELDADIADATDANEGSD